ncbi:MAG: DUF3168 domain-containing protein [Rubrivivax sp.]
MHPVQVFAAQLRAASAVTALVGAGDACRIYPLELPLGTAFPAIVIDYEDDAPIPVLDAQASYGIRQADVSLMLIAKTAPELQALSSACEQACNYQRGSIGGVNVVSIAPGSSTKAAQDSRLELWFLTLSFPLTYRR